MYIDAGHSLLLDMHLPTLAPTLHSFIVPAIGALLAYTCYVLIYFNFFHPLAKFPGPFINRFSNIPTYISVLRGRKNLYDAELVQKYGSPVRIAPNILIFGDSTSIRDIYRQSSNFCLKDPGLYKAFSITGSPNLVSAVDRHYHSRLRRLVSDGLSLRTILQAEEVISEHVQVLADAAFEPAVGNSSAVEVYDVVHNHFLDIISHMAFGKSFDAVRGRGLFCHTDLRHWMTIVPATALFPFLRYLPMPYIREGLAGVDRLSAFSREQVTHHAELCDQGKMVDGPTGKDALLTRLYTAVDVETSSKLSIDEIADNAVILLIGGSDTSSISSLYVLWEAGRNKRIWDKLAKEIRAACPDQNQFPRYEDVRSLEYFSAVVQESLRLWGPLNVLMPRVSPGKTISGHYVPDGTVVSTSTLFTCHDPTIFPQPDDFIPERWLNASTAMNESSRPFSTGPRGCVGRHLADVTMRLTLARLVQLYDLTPCEDMTVKMMATADKGSLQPKGQSLRLYVKPAQKL